MSRDYSDSEFLKLFFENCEHSPWRYQIEPWTNREQIAKIILDPNVEDITDEELAEKEKEHIEHALKVTRKHYTFLAEAQNMAKAKGYFKEE